ncbi:MAG TPA: hypothetical protein VM223_10260 [Planctomycetota bacterium]|nr:hypothetical protein [Planctomycetota bacterium]
MMNAEHPLTRRGLHSSFIIFQSGRRKIKHKAARTGASSVVLNKIARSGVLE